MPAGCNPYDQNERIGILLECVVWEQSSEDCRMCCGEENLWRRREQSIEIRWFRENTAGVVETLGYGDPIFRQSADLTSRYQDTKFLNQPYSPSLLGKYWCQVINTTADPDQPLMRSNAFTLLAPGNYNGSSCPEIQSTNNITCAHLSDNHVLQATSSVDPTKQSSQIELTPSTISSSECPSITAPDVTVCVGVFGAVLLVTAATQQVFIVILIVAIVKMRRRQVSGCMIG